MFFITYVNIIIHWLVYTIDQLCKVADTQHYILLHQAAVELLHGTILIRSSFFL